LFHVSNFIGSNPSCINFSGFELEANSEAGDGRGGFDHASCLVQLGRQTVGA
jgi:hypothetical protein